MNVKAIRNLLLIGHSREKTVVKKLFSGEILWGEKFKAFTDKGLVHSSPIQDIYHLLEGHLHCFKAWQKSEEINSFMALENEPLINDFGDHELLDIRKTLENLISELSAVVFFSWDRLLAPFLGLGLQKKYPVIVRCTFFHVEQRLSYSLYEEAHLILTESPLASQALVACGISKKKILLFPPSFSFRDSKMKGWGSKKNFFESISSSNKKIDPTKNLVGLYSRFIPSKNIELTLKILDALWQKNPTFNVLLRGTFDESGDGGDFEGYSVRLEDEMKNWATKPWLIWRQDSISHQEIIEEYKVCDLLISLSGSEGGSQTVTEWLGLGKAVVLLDASTQRSLFSKGACFVKPQNGFMKGKTWFKVPDIPDGLLKIGKMLSSKNLRRDYEKRALEWSHNFNEENSMKRVELLLKSAAAFYGTESDKMEISYTLLKQFTQDEKDFCE